MRTLVLACAAMLAVASRADVVLPDPRTGNVGGLAGVLYWPAIAPAGPGQTAQPLPSAQGCNAYLVPDANADEELRYPCGRWFAPAPGKYRVWLETADRISPTQNLLVYAGTPFRERGLAAVGPLVPSGGIGIPVGHAVPKDESIRLFSTRTSFWWSQSAWVFDRRIHDRTAQMPAGDSVILGRFDRKTNDAIALSRPITIRAAATQRLWPVEPKTSDVLVILRKPAAMQLRKPAPSARLTIDGRDADVLVNGGDRIIAIWYGVDAPRAKIAFDSDGARWQAREIRLTAGKVATVRDEVKALPSAKVSVNAPVDTKLPDDVTIEVRRNDAMVRKIDAGAGVFEMRELPAEPLRVVLRVGEWEWEERLDLTSGEDGNVAFDLEPLNIRGTVFHGAEPAHAEIEFRNGDDRWVAVKTDERGRYDTTLWWKDVQTVRVKLDGFPPFLDPFREIFESGSYDFRVPRTDYLVRVRDAESGRAIAGARVSSGNVANARLRVAQQILTNDDGEAVLPPLRDGELIVGVRAEGYEGIEQKLIVDDDHHEVDIALRPLRVTASVRVTLADGAPAADAEVWALDHAMNLLWSGKTQADGMLEVPDLANGVVFLVRHPRAASAVRRASEDEWRLDPPAEPLTLAVERSAAIAIWIDGVRLAGPTLSFATWSAPSANPDGVWTGRNLPRKPVQVVAGAIDTLSRQIEYPWP
ncbi:MAG TPA: carboxypeptidase regulatory-like domain-containing protein [Thermoanaerobaculia bacterium]|nr:carboxypeptidase regulatory-like domain-containing protein [Thermoanaerobaculia bacterium]